MSSDNSHNKLILSKRFLVIISILLAIILMIVKFTQSTDTKLSLNAWEDVHEWRAEGECSECHYKQEHVTKDMDFHKSLPMPAAQFHTEKFRRFTHGKEEDLASHNCVSCHQTDSCKSCHATIPETHTTDFIEPTGNSVGSFRHGILAKSNPSSCLACHSSFVESCVSCHTLDEVLPWQKNGEHSLSRWNGILGLE